MLTIQELCDRYSITRDRIYAWRNALKQLGVDVEFIKREGKSHAPHGLVKIFDQLSEWLKKGGNMANFSLTITPEVTVLPKQDNKTTGQTIQTRQDNKTEQPYLILTPEQIHDMATTMIETVQPILPKPDPFDYIDKLMGLAVSGIEISTLEVASLIGIKPSGATYRRGSFVFHKTGRIGNQAAWRVVLEPREIQGDLLI